MGLALTETLATGAEPLPRPVFAESVEYGPDRFSARMGTLKMIVTPFPARVHGNTQLEVEALEIFDLASDPHERRNLVTPPDEQASAILSSLTIRALERLGSQDMTADSPRLSKEQRERLRALGYLQ